MDKMTSIFQAEATAILRAINEVRDNVKTVILTDSLSTVKAISTNQKQDITVLNIKKKLMEKHLKIAWIPGHVGISGNEMADRLAREAYLFPNTYTRNKYK